MFRKARGHAQPAEIEADPFSCNMVARLSYHVWAERGLGWPHNRGCKSLKLPELELLMSMGEDSDLKDNQPGFSYSSPNSTLKQAVMKFNQRWFSKITEAWKKSRVWEIKRLKDDFFLLWFWQILFFG